MKLLIITPSYLPQGNPRAFRWGAIAEYWAAQGHRVDVVCQWESGRPRQETLGGVNVHRVGGGLAARIRAALRPPAGSSSGVDTPRAPRASWLRTAARWAYDTFWKPIYWPDSLGMWFFPARRQAFELLKAGRHDAMISVSHPFTGHLVGLALKRRHPALPWLVDTGDPFCFLTDTPTNNARLYRVLNHRVEREVFRRGDRHAVTTELTRQAYADLFPESASKIRVIPPLLSLPEEPADQPAIFPADGRLRLVFLGTLYRQIRSPEFLLALFERLLDTPIGPRLELHFFGNVHDCQPLFDRRSGWLGRQLFLHGAVDRATASRASRQASVLINIGNGTPYQLPSKVVEYASIGGPILNLVATAEDSSSAFFHAYPAAMTLMQGSGPSAGQVAELMQFLEHLPARLDPAMLTAWLAPYRIGAIAESYRRLLDPASDEAHAVENLV